MAKAHNITGKKYGMLTALSMLDRRNSGHAVWLFQCDCGRKKEIASSNVVQGHTRSCGCLLRKSTIERNTTHGLTGTQEHEMWMSAKASSVEKGLDFDIEVSDIVIPDMCPLLEIPLYKGLHKLSPNSPSFR